MDVYYCRWQWCGHHYDAISTLPSACPSCGRVAWWGQEPPRFEKMLTALDKKFLRVNRVRIDAVPEFLEPAEDDAEV